MESLLKVLQQHIFVSDSLIGNITQRVIQRRFKAKVKILIPDQDQASLLFLTKGITRNYYKTGTKEWTSRFSQAGDFVLSIDNFLLNLPCNEFIETCTPVEFLEIPKISYQQLLLINPELNLVVFNTINEYMRLNIKWMHSWQMQSAAERYHLFVKQYPDLHKQLQHQHIASYLGITPYSLSRIRTQYKREF